MHNHRGAFVAVRSLFLVALAAALNGCSYLSEITIPTPRACTPEVMSTLSASMVTPSLARRAPLVIQDLHLTPDSPPDQAARILSETFYQTDSKRTLGKMIDAMSPIKRAGGTVTAAGTVEDLHVSRAQLRREIEEIAKTAQAGGFRQLVDSKTVLGANRRLTANEERFFVQAEFFARYFEYYFRQGHLLIIGLDKKTATERLQKDLARSMGKDYDQLGAPAKKIVDDAVTQLLGVVCKGNACELFDFADADISFVTRAGQKFGFPVITLNIAPGSPRGFEVTKIDEIAIIGDLTRVAVEATFDTLQPNIPAIGTATGCVDKPLFATCEKVADEKLLTINKSGDFAEAIGGYVAALVVRGAWFASLNNEAFAKLVSTFISVGARKGAELGVWTAQQCRNDITALPIRTIRIVAEP